MWSVKLNVLSCSFLSYDIRLRDYLLSNNFEMNYVASATTNFSAYLTVEDPVMVSHQKEIRYTFFFTSVDLPFKKEKVLHYFIVSATLYVLSHHASVVKWLALLAINLRA